MLTWRFSASARVERFDILERLVDELGLILDDPFFFFVVGVLRRCRPAQDRP
jgi:hypothetical protein